MTTRHDYPDLPARPPQGLTPEARRRIGIERDPIDWGDLLVAVACVLIWTYVVWRWLA